MAAELDSRPTLLIVARTVTLVQDLGGELVSKQR